MSRLNQVLLLDPPHELRFPGPYKSDVTSHLELSNPTDHPVAFKVKTTAPKRYCVRPNSGIIEPKQAMKLVVILRSFDKDQPTEQARDKFMVQSIMCEDGTTWSESIFKDAAPDRLMDSKIRCVFDLSATQTPASAGGSGSGAGRDSGTGTGEDSGSRATAAAVVEEAVPGDYGSAVETIAQLREENSRLQREKLDLQEEAAKLRKRVAVAAVSAGADYAGSQSQAQKLGQSGAGGALDNRAPGVNLTMEILAVAFLVTFFVALFIGKTVL